MKKYLSIILLLLGLQLQAQQFNNEWIKDYSRPYYKFKIGKDSLCRISYLTLKNTKIHPDSPTNDSTLADTPAEQFQLWRNGKQVVLYTSISTGVFTTNDYIEFWGEQNDGKADKALYFNAINQLSDKLSLETDTAAFFLTVNVTPTASNPNLRYQTVANTIPSTPPAAESYFIHSLRYNFKEQVNRGYYIDVGEAVYSASYDNGEFLATRDIQSASPYSITAGNLFASTTGPAATFQMGLACNNANDTRTVNVTLNNTNILAQNISGFNAGVYSNNNIALSALTNTNSNFQISINTNDVSFDRIAVNFLELDYPHSFNFGGANNFSFSLPANASGNYLEINKFNGGTVAPVLYDVTNNKRYVADISNSSLLKFSLPATATATSYILVSEQSSNINSVQSLTQRNFINFSIAANQGDYLIISNKILGLTGSGAVETYRSYRSSAVGGSFNAKIYDIDELTDQFAFGIKKHPLSIKNFIQFANNKFAVKPKNVFLIGKGITYDQFRLKENSPNMEKLDLIPTFGWPASDALLASADLNPVPVISIGRLSAITQQEVLTYLDKVKQFEQQATSTAQTITNKAWMKQLVHISGSPNDAGLDQLLTNYLKGYENIIVDTAFGGTVANFNSTNSVDQSAATTARMNGLFSNGIAMLTYFGHSAATSLSYHLSDPNDFNNQGKYPLFLMNGCNAGDFFDFDTLRFTSITSLAEKFVFAPQRGAIGYIASSHFGLTDQLNTYATGFYKTLSTSNYNQDVGKSMLGGSLALQPAFSNNFFSKIHGEEIVLHGDPAIKVYASNKPDFVIEDPQVSVSPTFISVKDNQFNFKAYIYNIGKATGDSVNILITRKYPSGVSENLFNKRIKSIRYIDSVLLTIPVISSRDKGSNSITITVDNDNKYGELSELNNSITKTFVIYEDELTPNYPYNFSIINKSTIKLQASSADPLSVSKQYAMEMDTTALFNSSFKISKTVTSVGGAIEFDPSITLVDSTVYYWRVAPVPSSGSYLWNSNSFIYLKNSSSGYNQSHIYQQTKSTFNNIKVDTAAGKFSFTKLNQTFTIRNQVYPYGGEDGGTYSVAINDAINPAIAGMCWRPTNVTFNVFNPVTLKAMFNNAIGQPGQYGSLDYNASGCTSGKEYDFSFDIINGSAGRKAAMDFMDNQIPNGSYVIVRSQMLEPWGFTFIDTWKNDTTLYGHNNSLYHRLKTAGFADVDSFNRPRCFAFVYQKNNNVFTPVYKLSVGVTDKLTFVVPVTTSAYIGTILSPKFGPVQQWNQMIWDGTRTDAYDSIQLKLLGIKPDGTTDVLQTINESQKQVNISSYNATTYPYMQLSLTASDTVNFTPYQLKYWRLLANMLPEGAIAPNIKYSFTADTLDAGQQLNVAVAFKNISDINFSDSAKVKIQIIDKNNNTQNLPANKLKKIVAGDTTVVTTTIDTKNFVGNNTLYININSDNLPQEQSLANNFLYKNFYVRSDNTNPILDVTFDGVHILNNDIVSSKPTIHIKLKDESKYLALDDTSLLSIQVRFPDNSLHRYKFGTDTLKFNPANLSSGDNSATADLTPFFATDGTYQLIVQGKDKSNNASGTVQYTVNFSVYNKPMISNVFNYPNPFTTSTAFVFTLTGNQLPQNIRIQILTVTGKIVREITKDELGPIHIGRNITDFKWDGTDTYGSKLANGVYLYRIITNLDGNSLDKFSTKDLNGNDVDTDKFFKAGYGKMYLMR